MTTTNAIDALSGRAITGLSAVTGAVRNAAARTGVDFSYLMAQARVESGLNPQAKTMTSSARGLYQFTSSTWLDTVRKHGAEHGLGWAAEAISKGAAGAGSAARATILSLRDIAEAAALMAGEFAADNGALLEKKLGRAAGATDLYMAHFLGASGAGKFLGILAKAPETAAAALFPAAAAANRGVFFARDGSPRSMAEIYQRFADKLAIAPAPSVTPIRMADSGNAMPATGNVLPVEASRARLAYMLLAELGA